MDRRTIEALLLVSTLSACAEDRAPSMFEGDTDEGTSATENGDSGEEQGSSDKFDLLGESDAAGENIADCGSGNSDSGEAFSIIWIANSSEGTVSKVDTAQAVELARYRTGP